MRDVHDDGGDRGSAEGHHETEGMLGDRVRPVQVRTQAGEDRRVGARGSDDVRASPERPGLIEDGDRRGDGLIHVLSQGRQARIGCA